MVYVGLLEEYLGLKMPVARDLTKTLKRAFLIPQNFSGLNYKLFRRAQRFRIFSAIKRVNRTYASLSDVFSPICCCSGLYNVQSSASLCSKSPSDFSMSLWVQQIRNPMVIALRGSLRPCTQNALEFFTLYLVVLRLWIRFWLQLTQTSTFSRSDQILAALRHCGEIWLLHSNLKVIKIPIRYTL